MLTGWWWASASQHLHAIGSVINICWYFIKRVTEAFIDATRIFGSYPAPRDVGAPLSLVLLSGDIGGETCYASHLTYKISNLNRATSGYKSLNIWPCNFHNVPSTRPRHKHFTGSLELQHGSWIWLQPGAKVCNASHRHQPTALRHQLSSECTFQVIAPIRKGQKNLAIMLSWIFVSQTISGQYY